jgi:hypothetical protein
MTPIPTSAQGDSAQAAPKTNEVKKFSLNPAEAGYFFKSLLIAYGLSLSDTYIIMESAILGFLWNGAGKFRVDLTKALGKNLNLRFIFDSTQLKVLSLFRNSKVYLIESLEKSVYEMTDRQNTVSLPKCSGRTKAPTIPVFTEEEKVGEVVTVKEFQKLRSVAQASCRPYSILNIYSGQLKTVQLPGLAPYVLDPAAYRECSGKPDVSLKSFSLVIAPGDEVELSIFKIEDAYWFKAEAEIALGTTLEIFEQVSTLNV